MTKLILILCLLLTSCMSIYDRQPDDLSSIEPASTIDYKLLIIVNYNRLSSNKFKARVMEYIKDIDYFRIRYEEITAMGGERYTRIAVIYYGRKDERN